MRLYRLSLRAIGPFPGEHSIDFERLGASGLFLLEGPTGSGKSTVIDAVVFALYGQVAGSDASNDRMHSDFAAPGVEPFVELDFETSSGLYRVRRTPRYDRPKSRGDGTVSQNATARLWRLTSPDAEPDSDAVATSVSEVSSEVVRAVGLTREQFVKTVVLPQGEFAAFLRAGAEERRALLQRLFGTELYDHAQARMEERRRAALQQREESDVRVREAVAAFAGAVGLPEEGRQQLDAVMSDDESLVAALTGPLEGAQQQLAAAEQALRAAETERVEADRRLSSARRHEELRRAKAALLAERSQVEAAEPDQTERRTRLAAAERAARVAAALGFAEEAERRAGEADQALDAARGTLPERVRGLDPAGWEATERTCRDAAAGLAELHLVEEGLADREHALREAELARAELRRQLAAVEEQLVLLPERSSAAREQEQAARIRAAASQPARAAVDEAQRRLASAQLLAGLREQLAAAAAAVERCRGAAAQATDDEHRVRRLYVDGMAGHLGAALVDGEPCPVCGSVEHPRPARPAPDAPDRDTVDRAEQTRKDAMSDLDGATAAHAALEVQVAAAEVASGGATVLQAQAALREAELAQADADLAALDVDRLQAEVSAIATEQQEAEARRRSVEQQLTTADVDWSKQAAAIASDRDRLAEARGEDRSVAERRRRLLAEASALSAARGAADESRRAADDWSRRRDELAEVASDQGFAAPAAAASALLDEAALATLREAVVGHDERRAAVADRLADAALVAVDVSDERDLEPLEAALTGADRAAQDAQEARARADQRATDAAARLEAVRAATLARRALVETTAPVIRMANLVTANTADNTLRMTLATFVLLERFRDVVAAANQRLDVMSDSRYRLEHVVEKDGGRRSGLGLLVRDNDTEKPRQPGTLSGGETFYCSLALALGLADVVTAEAGGIDLGTLFVDEGFGTLDADRLEQVIDVLSGLRAGGRTVGIVSHVSELKDRISERVEVRREADGSSRIRVVA